MKILFTHRYFWPDSPPYGAMLRSLSTALAARGHRVEVFAGQPSYAEDAQPVAESEVIDGVRVSRIAMRRENKGRPLVRLWNALSYCAQLYRKVRKSDARIVTAASFPPVLAAWCASLAARRSGKKFIYHLQDVHPEVALASGGVLAWPPLLALLRWIDGQTLRRADRIVILSEDMARTLRSRRARFDHAKIRIINNFQVDSFADEEARSDLPMKASGKVRAIFAGNLGAFQRLELFIDAARIVEKELPDFELVLLGNGASERSLKQRAAGLGNVQFHEWLPYSQARHVIADADVGLVSLMPGIVDVSYPSKTFTYLGLGVPLAVVVEPESELARMVCGENLGFCARDATPGGVADLFREIAARRETLGELRSNASAYFDQSLTGHRAFDRWDEVIGELAHG